MQGGRSGPIGTRRSGTGSIGHIRFSRTIACCAGRIRRSCRLRVSRILAFKEFQVRAVRLIHDQRDPRGMTDLRDGADVAAYPVIIRTGKDHC